MTRAEEILESVSIDEADKALKDYQTISYDFPSLFGDLVKDLGPRILRQYPNFEFVSHRYSTAEPFTFEIHFRGKNSGGRVFILGAFKEITRDGGFTLNLEGATKENTKEINIKVSGGKISHMSDQIVSTFAQLL